MVSFENVSLDDSGVVYFGLNGYGITWTYLLIHLAMIIMACLGVTLNVAALRIVRSNPLTSDGSRIFISHLAMSDIFNSIICTYITFYNLIHYKNYYECAFRTGLSTCILLNSSLHLLSLTFDRYFRIMYPYKYVLLFTESRMKKCSVSIWAISLSLGMLPMFGWRQPPFDGLSSCSYFGVLSKPYLVLMSLLFYCIQATMFFCYFSILFVAWNQSCKIMKTSADSYSYWNTKALWWGPTKTVIILISFYSCCWLPTGIVVLLHLVDGFPSMYTENQKGVVLAYTSSLVFLNIIANPVIYAVKIRRVRRKVRAAMEVFSVCKGSASNPI